ncbi:MAG TPA: isoleucine--tRNA ligase [Acidimicrobiales bacterium]|nr:isoleucine--tRNA ligase [Acidimicrobiales bacterium]
MSDPPAAGAPYPDVPQPPDYPRLEEQVLESWAKDHTFEASVEARPGGANEFVFYDGPPFANGLPHYGHLLTGFVKDVVPRYQTMRGRRVERRFGWDCHGLPAEMAAEKELELSGRAGVADYGVDNFNDYCRALVQRTTDAWERYVTRQARWVDFANDYKTMDLPYMESVLWAFKQLHDKGLLYEGERVLPYCWECETPLSNFETRQDDAYRPREDPAVTVAFTLDPDDAAGGPPVLSGALRMLAWTTTPWTLPSNLALAVGPDVEYGVYELLGAPTVVATARVGAYPELFGDAPPLAVVRGSALVGRRYRPLFPFFAEEPGAFRVLAGDFVATDEGTGVVHLAPGFGEEDFALCQEAGMGLVCPVDDRGRFTAEVGPYAGQLVFDANAAIADDLQAAGVLLQRERYTHSYPHCWRTDTPLIYKAVGSWFVQVTAIKDRMLEHNQAIDWIPAHIRDGAFGKWLEGARDWSISRNRFWGSPIPVWKSDDPRYPRTDVYGSLDELEADFGVRVTDLHRPAIDELVRPNPDDPTGRSSMRRVTDVLDCWFESGSMPFAQVHYPFERRDWFDSHFPADFIVEYVSQTRGWFYTLHVLAVALFDRPPFRHCVVHGVVLGDDGRKMSKRLENFPEPDMVFDVWGADAMRWFLVSSPVLRGQDLVVHAKGIGDVRDQVLNPIWNAWHFLALYANVDGIRGRFRADAAGVLDRYIIAKAAALVDEVTATMDRYDLYGACAEVTAFLDALTNWYIRRSRDRFWRARDGSPAVEADKADAYDTLATVLETLCTVAAPLLPLLTETVYRGLTGARSVHLAPWPAPGALRADPELVEAMDLVRAVCSAAHAVRKANGRRARLPLRRLRVATARPERLEPFRDLIADEVNVKEVVLSDQVGEEAEEVLTLVHAALGPRLGAQTQAVTAAVRQGRWRRTDAGVEAGGVALEEGEYRLVLRPRNEAEGRTLPGDQGVVTLDTAVDEALESEGLARDAVRLVQKARRDAGLHVSDWIALAIAAPPAMAAAVEARRAYVAEQTLAAEVRVSVADEVSIELAKAPSPRA